MSDQQTLHEVAQLRLRVETLEKIIEQLRATDRALNAANEALNGELQELAKSFRSYADRNAPAMRAARMHVPIGGKSWGASELPKRVKNPADVEAAKNLFDGGPDVLKVPDPGDPLPGDSAELVQFLEGVKAQKKTRPAQPKRKK